MTMYSLQHALYMQLLITSNLTKSNQI